MDNFWNDIILLNLNRFENIGIDFYINIFLFIVAVAVCIFAIYIELTRGNIQLFALQLKRHKAYDPENAKTLHELGLDKKLILKFLIKNNRMLSRLVLRSGYVNLGYEEYLKLSKKERNQREKIDFENEKFYINPDASSRVDDISSTYSFSLVRLFMFCLLIMLIYFALASLSLEILCAINSALDK